MRIILIGAGCGVIQIAANYLDLGHTVVINPVEPEFKDIISISGGLGLSPNPPLELEYKVRELLPEKRFNYRPNPRPWERKKKGQRR